MSLFGFPNYSFSAKDDQRVSKEAISCIGTSDTLTSYDQTIYVLQETVGPA